MEINASCRGDAPARRLVRGVPGRGGGAPEVALAGAGELPCGVTTAPCCGELVTVEIGGDGAGVLVECGGEIGAGDLAKSDADGRAVSAVHPVPYVEVDPTAPGFDPSPKTVEVARAALREDLDDDEFPPGYRRRLLAPGPCFFFGQAMETAEEGEGCRFLWSPGRIS